MSTDPTPRELVDRLITVLSVEPIGTDAFIAARPRASTTVGAGRVYGGQLIAQALVAAESTVDPDRPVHSLHAYFLRMGDEAQDIRYDVARDLDGGSFSNRRIAASQGGRPILSLNASFHKREDGVRHQDAMPDVPPPESLLDDFEKRRGQLDRFPETARAAFGASRPIEQRSVEPYDWMEPVPAPPVTHTWFRACAPLGDDPRVHRAVLAYASDLMLLRTVGLPHGLSWFRGNVMEASLDHAMWFHDDFRADEWLLYRTQSGWAGRARGFTTGQMFRRDGTLIASLSQEGIVRLTDKG